MGVVMVIKKVNWRDVGEYLCAPAIMTREYRVTYLLRLLPDYTLHGCAVANPYINFSAEISLKPNLKYLLKQKQTAQAEQSAMLIKL